MNGYVKPRYVREYEDEPPPRYQRRRLVEYEDEEPEPVPRRRYYVRDEPRPAARGWAPRAVSPPPRVRVEPPPPRGYEVKRPREDPYAAIAGRDDRQAKHFHHKTFLSVRTAMVDVYDKLTSGKASHATASGSSQYIEWGAHSCRRARRRLRRRRRIWCRCCDARCASGLCTRLTRTTCALRCAATCTTKTPRVVGRIW